MSSFDHVPRRVFLLTSLAACGFQPLNDREQNAHWFGKVQLPEVDDQNSFWINRELRKAFGDANDPTYALSIDYKLTTANLAVTQSNIVTRKRLTAKGTFYAHKLATNATILAHDFHRVASYSANNDRFASDQAEVSTEEKMAIVIAEEFASRFRNALVRSEQR